MPRRVQYQRGLGGGSTSRGAFNRSRQVNAQLLEARPGRLCAGVIDADVAFEAGIHCFDSPAHCESLASLPRGAQGIIRSERDHLPHGWVLPLYELGVPPQPLV